MRKTKFLFESCCCFLFCNLLQAQEQSPEKALIPIEKKGFFKDVQVLLTTRMGFDADFENRNHLDSKFNIKDFRLDAKGAISENVFFRFRHRFTGNSDAGIDRLSQRVDMAFVGLKVSPKTTLVLGKTGVDWGGYEYDLNPIDILQYNEILNHSDGFVTGLSVAYQASEAQSFGLQLANARSGSLLQIYEASDQTLPEGITIPQTPMRVAMSWQGSFCNGLFQTRYSLSRAFETKQKSVDYLVLGNKLQKDKWSVMYDFHYSKEQIDSKSMASVILGGSQIAQDVSYLENWMRASYQISSSWNVIVSVMQSDTYAPIASQGNKTQRLSRSLGYIPSVEWKPFSNMDLRFYAAYAARDYYYTDTAKELGSKNYNKGTWSVGLVGPLQIF